MQRKIIAGTVIAILLLSVFVAGILTSRPEASNARARGDVAVINIGGVITTGGSTSGLLGGVTSGSNDINSQIRQVAENPNIKAVVLRLNSPGGTVAGTQEIAQEIDRLRKSGKKVVASMGDVAASGAYWIASRCDKVVANPGTMTGSIGVIMQTENLEGLYEKLGIEEYTFKSGKYKDMGSPTRQITEDEKAIMQEMVDEHYEHFVTAVAEGRSMDIENARELATGRVFTGSQAKDVGLVDEMGNFYDAIDLAAQLAGIPGKPSVIHLEREKSWWDILGTAKVGTITGNDVRYFLEAYPPAWFIYMPDWKVGINYDGGHGKAAC